MKLELIPNQTAHIEFSNGVVIYRYIIRSKTGAVKIVYNIEGMDENDAAKLADRMENESFHKSISNMQECVEAWEMMKQRIAKDVEAEIRGWK